MGELTFSWGDLYPAMTNVDTGSLATPEADDQAALNEPADLAEKADSKNSRTSYVFLAIVMIIALVILTSVL